MARWTWTLLVASTVLLSAAGGAWPAEGAKGSNQPADAKETGPLIVRATAAKRDYSPLEPIVITVETANPPGLAIPVLYHNNKYKMYRFFATNAFGELMPPTRYYEQARHAPTPFGRVLWGGYGEQRMKCDLTLNLACDMTEPGEYSVVVGVVYGGLQTMEGGREKVARSNVLTIRVLNDPKLGL